MKTVTTHLKTGIGLEVAGRRTTANTAKATRVSSRSVQVVVSIFIDHVSLTSWFSGLLDVIKGCLGRQVIGHKGCTPFFFGFFWFFWWYRWRLLHNDFWPGKNAFFVILQVSGRKCLGQRWDIHAPFLEEGRCKFCLLARLMPLFSQLQIYRCLSYFVDYDSRQHCFLMG